MSADKEASYHVGILQQNTYISCSLWKKAEQKYMTFLFCIIHPFVCHVTVTQESILIMVLTLLSFRNSSL